MTDTKDLIAIVNEKDEITGYEDKLIVHQKGLLHRAFSIFVFNRKGEIMLQRRSFSKYHSGGLWTNTCCSHKLPDENFEETIHNRLNFEMGFDCDLHYEFTFQYRVAFKNNLVENEIDHVYIGYFEGNAKPNPDEVCDWKLMSVNEIKKDLEDNEELYTYWFKIAFNKLLEHKPTLQS